MPVMTSEATMHLKCYSSKQTVDLRVGDLQGSAGSVGGLLFTLEHPLTVLPIPALECRLGNFAVARFEPDCTCVYALSLS